MTSPVLTVTALEVRRELPSGKTKPLVCLCEVPDNDTDEFVVKFRSRVTNDLAGLAAEYIAARLAACLGVPQPQFAIVDISAELIESSTGTVYEEVLRENPGYHIGTQYLEGYSTWIESRPFVKKLHERMSDVFAFDAIIDNADRRRTNPNLLQQDDELYVIDHEMAFGFLYAIEYPAPFDRTYQQYLREHPFARHLKEHDFVLDGFVERLRLLESAEIKTIVAEAEILFKPGNGERIETWLNQCVDRAGDMTLALTDILK